MNTIKEEVNIELLFTQPTTIQQADMLEVLNNLTPQQRTELLTEYISILAYVAHTVSINGGLKDDRSCH